MGIRNNYNFRIYGDKPSGLRDRWGYYGSPEGKKEQYYRDPQDDLVYDSRGNICPGLVRYGGIRPGVRYQNKEMGGTRQYVEGGMVTPLPGGAVEFTGRTHEEGGIVLPNEFFGEEPDGGPITEVEDGETLDKIQGQDYFFSNHLKLGGKTFAKRHKELLAIGAGQEEIEELAEIQEAVAGRDKHNLEHERKYQSGGRYIKWPSDYRYPESEFWYYQNSDGSTIKFDNEEDYLKHKATTGDSLENLGEQTYSSYLQTGNDFYRIMGATDPPSEEPITPVIGDEDGPVLTEVNSPNDDSDQTNISEPMGYLYDGTTDAEWEEYREEAETITGIDNFDFRNPQHIESLQTVLLAPGEDLDSTYFSGQEPGYITGDLGIHQAGIDGKAGADTLAALREKSEQMEKEATEGEDDSGGMQIEPNLYNQGTIVDPYAFVEGEEEGTPDEFYTEGPTEEIIEPEIREGEEEEQQEEEMVPPTSNWNMPKKGFNWGNLATGLAAGLQLLPAYMAYKEKPDYMGAPGRLNTIHLARTRFNDAYAANEANYHGMSRFIEQSGLGPGAIANRMAAWDKKQTGDMKIAGEEARMNVGIQNQETKANMMAQQFNIKNRMAVDEFNRAADAVTKDRKLMAVQNAVQSLAGMNRDRLMYKAEQDKARAIAGPTGTMDRFEFDKRFRKANRHLTGKAYNDAFNQAWLAYTGNAQLESQKFQYQSTTDPNMIDPSKSTESVPEEERTPWYKRIFKRRKNEVDQINRGGSHEDLSAEELEAIRLQQEEEYRLQQEQAQQNLVEDSDQSMYENPYWDQTEQKLTPYNLGGVRFRRPSRRLKRKKQVYG